MAIQEQKKQISINNQIISYTLSQKNVKNINLRIKTNGQIKVSAHPSVKIETIDNFIISKADFINKHLAKFAAIAKQSPKTEQKQYLNGENFMLLGQNLSLILSQSNEDKIYQNGLYLHLYLKDPANFNKRASMVDGFFNQQARAYFEQIAGRIYPLFSDYRLAYPKIKLRKMSARWGSCLPLKQQIILNKKLIAASPACIEYVILHEFAHFVHPNHSPRFYALLSQLMPDWQERKKKLAAFI